ncbi:MAG TPA: GNAT family N-acetyltransferase [Solirubrobacteraceae bacterium]|nr:GNAT family N-acetyltransferase [Solirubrobacteraceae bacterium]
MPSREPELVNPVPVEEVGPWVRAMATTFLHDHRSPGVQGWIDQLLGRWNPERAWGIRDGGRWVATLRTEPRRLTVPGPPGAMAEVEVDAVTNVTVAATHRRRGLMTRMLESSLRAARERGDTLGALIPAEWPIYGRFGYAPATLSADYVLHRSQPGVCCEGSPGAIRQVELAEAAEVAPALFDQARRQWAGQMDRDAGWWQRNLGLEGTIPREPAAPNWFLHEGAQGVDGVLAWSPVGSPSLLAAQQQVDVQALFTTSLEAYRDLWAYLTSIDGIDQVSLELRPVAEPVRWLLANPRALVERRRVDFLWVRVLDVPAALRARSYALAGELVLEVSDPHSHGFATGRYRLNAGPDGAGCERVDADPDVWIEQRALASILLGGFRLAELEPAGMAQERRPGGLARADLMFSTAGVPWNATWF